jgi:hypothetical protein
MQVSVATIWGYTWSVPNHGEYQIYLHLRKRANDTQRFHCIYLSTSNVSKRIRAILCHCSLGQTRVRVDES